MLSRPLRPVAGSTPWPVRPPATPAHDAGNAGPCLRHEAIRHVINTLAMDLIGAARPDLGRMVPCCADGILHAARPVVASSPAIRHFLYARPCRHWRVNRMARKALLRVESILAIPGSDMTPLPDATSAPAPAPRAGGDMTGACRVVADYSAGMTDRCAMEAYRRLTDLSPPG
ncbi:hypothetical protein [Komagataeibacter sp. NFXK3]